MTQEVREELPWRIIHLELSNGKSLVTVKPQLIVALDASVKRRKAFCQGHKKCYFGSKLKAKEQVNVLELRAAKFAKMTFTAHNKILSDLAKEIWDFLIINKITTTVKYLLGILNVEADLQL